MRCAITLMLVATGACFAGDSRSWVDDAGDAVLRRTDPGGDGLVPETATLPDVLSVRFDTWRPFNASANPFVGVVDRDGHFVRIDMAFAGLINPPGTIGLGGLPYEPFVFGPSPLLGFLEVDIDNDRDTGGELGPAADHTFLANMARFGMLPDSSIRDRAVLRSGDLDGSFYTYPQYERSGADFVVVLCGCHEVTLKCVESGDEDALFEVGEVWRVESRFFQRAAGYQEVSAVSGGSAGGLYDPIIEARFGHELATDRTLVSIVFPLDMEGGALWFGEDEQQIDRLIETDESHFSVEEALDDLIEAASYSNSGPAGVLVEEWDGEDADRHLEPGDWRMNGLFATAYAVAEQSLYPWTDIIAGRSLEAIETSNVRDEIATADGTSSDADSVFDGTLTVVDHPVAFNAFDLDADGLVETADLYLSGCPADLTGSLMGTIVDLLLFLDAWFDASVDLDGDGITNIVDLLLYLDAWLDGC